MSFTTDFLNEEIVKKGLYLPEGIKFTNGKLVKFLGDNYLKEHRDEWTFGKMYVQSLTNVMLCKHYKDEKDSLKEDPFTSPNWIAEIKKDDFRTIITFDPYDGFELFSRRESSKTFLNSVFTDKVLFIKNSVVRQPQDFKGVFNYRFVLDCGTTVNSDNLNFEGIEYANIDDLLQGILGSSPERAKDYQKNGNTLIMNAFDILYFEKDPKPIEKENLPKYIYEDRELSKEDVEWVREYFKNYLYSSGFVDKNDNILPLNGKTKKLYQYLITLKDTDKNDLRKLPFMKRRILRDKVVDFLQQNNLPFVHIDTENENKLSYAEQLIREGFEGVILKSLHAPYISDMASSRSHKTMLKVKSSVTQLLTNMDIHEDMDVYISGANPPKSKNIKDMIGSLECSIYLEDEDGSICNHIIGYVSGIPHKVKKDMTIIDEEGNAVLNPEYLNKVIAINGMSLSHLSLRFNHCVLKNRDEERLVIKNKNAIDCVWQKNVLENMISIRGQR